MMMMMITYHQKVDSQGYIFVTSSIGLPTINLAQMASKDQISTNSIKLE